MVQVCRDMDVAAFESNFKKPKSVIANNPAHLEYLCESHDHPELFAQYKINEVEGSMIWYGSQFLDANHASIVSR